MRFFRRKSKRKQSMSAQQQQEEKHVTEQPPPPAEVEPQPQSQFEFQFQTDQPPPVKDELAQPPRPEPVQPVRRPPSDGPAWPLPANVPLGMDPTMNEEIAAIWIEVQDRVQKLAEHEGKVVRPGLDIGDVIANLDASQEKEEESVTAQAVKTAFGRTMGLIKTVGGIVSDGASSVFAPAGQCYNVISFLINAYDGYQGAFDGLAELLEKCSDHLGRLDYYVKGGMDTRLSKVAAQQLLLFVKICDAALKLRYSAGEKIKTGLKIAFLDENSIQGLLGEMSKLAERERGLVSAQTFHLASAAAANSAAGAAFGRQVLDTLAKDGAERKERVEKEGNMKTLLEVLSFDKSSPQWDNSKQEPVEFWQTAYNKIRQTVVPGTGDWLLSDYVFQSWGVDTSTPPILGVEGTESTGKSYLTSSVVKYLRTEMATQHPESRHLVAFDFLDRKDIGGGFDAVARSLVWQFADKDEPYLKSAARISQNTRSLDPDEILPQLLLDNKELKHIDATFYIVIDGLHDTLDDSLLKFLQRAAKCQNKTIRIFLTGTPTAFEHLKRNGVAFRSIPINPKNRTDIERFIDTRMDKFDALSDTDRIGVVERRKEIREQLSQNTAGDFFKLDTALNAISNLDYMDDINRVIEGAGKERSEQIYEEIQMLNRVRSSRQINEINKIILWITFTIDRVTAEQISAVLYMNSGEAPLRPLGERFRTKYLLFQVDSEGYVGFRSSKALDVIPQRHQLIASKKQNDQEVQPGEIEIVTHFLTRVCPPGLYKKLELEEYLQQKINQRQGQIQQEDKDTGHILLALDCLHALTERSDASIAVLQEYARENFIKHLSLVDLAMVDREWKSQVGSSLAKLFMDDECIDALLLPGIYDARSVWKAGAAWLFDDQNVEKVVRWFKDTAVRSGIANLADRSWIEHAMSGNIFGTLLRPSVVRMAYHCLREPCEGYLSLYSFVCRYLFKVNAATEDKIAQQDAEDQEGKDGLSILTFEATAQFEQWAQDALQVAQKDTLWQTQMAKIYGGTHHRGKAIERCRFALELDHLNWRASHLLAKMVPSNEEAIEILKTVVSRQERDLVWMQDPAHVEAIADMNFELGDRYWKAQQYEIAISTYAASFKQDPTWPERFEIVFGRYSSVKNWMAIVSLIEQLVVAGHQKHLGYTVFTFADWKPIHQLLRDTAVATKRFDILGTVYKEAIQTAADEKNYEASFLTRYYYGLAMYELPNRREDKVIGLWEAALKEDFPSSGLDADQDLPILYSRLGGLYLQKARIAKANEDPESAMDYIGRISDMVPEEVSQSNLFFPPQLYAARFYHLEGNDAQARQIVRTMVQVALEILSDDDEDNDIEAFQKLLFVFLPLGDTKNVLAALALITLSTRSSSSDGAEYWLGFNCDGHCGHVWETASEMWLCEDCIEITVEQDCLEKIQDGKLEYNICDKSHHFVQVPKWDEGRMDSLPTGTVPWGDENITLNEWKQKIKEAYLDLDS